MEQDETGLTTSERAAIVTARGTSDGLVIRLDGRLDHESIRKALNDFLISRKAFLAGNEIVLEWIGSKPEKQFLDELSETLADSFDIEVKASRLREQPRVSISNNDFDSGIPHIQNRDIKIREIGRDTVREVGFGSRDGYGTGSRDGYGAGSRDGYGNDDRNLDHKSTGQKAVSLFDGIEALRLGDEAESDQPLETKGRYAGDTSLWDDADARVVYCTLRSGQKIETEHSLVIFGDVNSGAEIIAGGDIIVIGTLRGVAHAGAYDETGGGRVIFALKLQPTQLRIGMVISQGASETQNVPELARVEDNLIVVEPYQSKTIWSKR